MNTLKTIFIFICILVFALLFIYILTLLIKSSSLPKKYNIILPETKNGKNAVSCLPGCVRGRCKNNKLPNNCKYDFQCDYCEDKDTSLLYVDVNNYRTIQPLYEEEGLSSVQKRTLNNEIDDNNKYIQKLNNIIMTVNKNKK